MALIFFFFAEQAFQYKEANEICAEIPNGIKYLLNAHENLAATLVINLFDVDWLLFIMRLSRI